MKVLADQFHVNGPSHLQGKTFTYSSIRSLFVIIQVYECPHVSLCLISMTVIAPTSLTSSIQSSDSTKPKDPPWLALVKQESKKKLAPPPPRAVATPPHSTCSSAKIEEETRPDTPPNPFEDDDNAEAEPESAEAAVPSSVVAVHPWYGISQNAEGTTENPIHSMSPGSCSSKKRLAPRAPKSVPTGQCTEKKPGLFLPHIHES